MASSLQSLFLMLVLLSVAAAFVLQDLPLERFERSGHSEELMAPIERESRAAMIFRPAQSYLNRYRMYSGR